MTGPCRVRRAETTLAETTLAEPARAEITLAEPARAEITLAEPARAESTPGPSPLPGRARRGESTPGRVRPPAKPDPPSSPGLRWPLAGHVRAGAGTRWQREPPRAC